MASDDASGEAKTAWLRTVRSHCPSLREGLDSMVSAVHYQALHADDASKATGQALPQLSTPDGSNSSLVSPPGTAQHRVRPFEGTADSPPVQPDAVSSSESDDSGSSSEEDSNLWGDGKLIPSDPSEIRSLVGGWPTIIQKLRSRQGVRRFKGAARLVQASKLYLPSLLRDREEREQQEEKNRLQLENFERTDAPQYVGTRAREHFFRMYREDVVQRNCALGERSPRSKFLSVLQDKQLPPKPLGIVRYDSESSGSGSEAICLRQRHMGDDYAEAFGSALGLTDGIRTLDLSGNNLGRRGLSAIVGGVLTSQARRQRASEVRAASRASMMSRGSMRNRSSHRKKRRHSRISTGDGNGGSSQSAATLISLNLSNNLLGNSGASLAALVRGVAVEAVSSSTDAVAARRDSVGLAGVSAVCRGPNSTALPSTGCVLSELRLKNCGIDPQSLVQLFSALEKNNTLTTLDLSEIHLGGGTGRADTCPGPLAIEEGAAVDAIQAAADEAADAGGQLRPAASLLRLMVTTSHISSIGLSRCGIAGAAATILCAGLRGAKSLVTLDLSWNMIGSAPSDQAVLMLADSLGSKACSGLLHLDLSHCSLSIDDCSTLNEALRPNRTLLGLHLDGNGADVDARGRLRLHSSMVAGESGYCHSVAHHTNLVSLQAHVDADILNYPNNANSRPTDPIGTCWLCDRWNEVLFVWKPEHSILLRTQMGVRMDSASGAEGASDDTGDVAQSDVDDNDAAMNMVADIGDLLREHTVIRGQGQVLEGEPDEPNAAALEATAKTSAMEQFGMCNGQGGRAHIISCGAKQAAVQKPQNMFLHLSCDDFEPHLMDRQGDGSFTLPRMVPPFNVGKARGERGGRGAVTYYFSCTFDVEIEVKSEDNGGENRPVLDTERQAALDAPPRHCTMRAEFISTAHAIVSTVDASLATDGPASFKAAASQPALASSDDAMGVIGNLKAKQRVRQAEKMLELFDAKVAQGDSELEAVEAAVAAVTVGSVAIDAEDEEDVKQAPTNRVEIEREITEARQEVRATCQDLPSDVLRRPPAGLNQLFATQGDVWTECNDALPRVAPAEPHKPKASWTLPKSIFGGRAAEANSKTYWDDESVLDRAFEADFSRTDVPELLQKHGEKLARQRERAARHNKGATMQLNEPRFDFAFELAQVKMELREHYEYITDVFIAYSAQSLVDPFTISWNAYRDLLVDCNIPDEPGTRADGGMPCTVEVCDACFMRANQESEAEKSLDNSDRSLCRYELMEVLVLIAEAKYLGAPPQEGEGTLLSDSFGLRSTFAYAIEKLFEDHINPHGTHYDNDDWRDARLYKEDVHLLLKHHRGALQKLFQKYCLIGAKRMKVHEFIKLLACEGILDERVTKREAVLAFLLSKMLYIDDMKSTARKSLSFIDFLEALGRVSDMQTRTGDLRFQPWDTETEGISEVPLHVSMRDGLFAQLLAK